MRQLEVIWSTASETPVSKKIAIDLPNGMTDLQICEAVFQDTNTYGGSIWEALLPLPEDRTHTSLSVGDHVRIDGLLYRCQFVGFEQVDELIPNLRFLEPEVV